MTGEIEGRAFGDAAILYLGRFTYVFWSNAVVLLMAEIWLVYPIIYRVSYIPGGAGFQPSTVVNELFRDFLTMEVSEPESNLLAYGLWPPCPVRYRSFCFRIRHQVVNRCVTVEEGLFFVVTFGGVG